MSAPWLDSSARFVYRTHIRVQWRDCDLLGHVNNATYLTYLEQVAIDHADAVGWSMEHLRPHGGLFIARRHEIDYLRPAGLDDRLQIVTWPTDFGAARAARSYRMYKLDPSDETVLADGLFAPDEVTEPGPPILTARTDWAFVDPATGRPRRIPTEVTSSS